MSGALAWIRRLFGREKRIMIGKTHWCGCPEFMSTQTYILFHSRRVVRGADGYPVAVVYECEASRRYWTEPFERVEVPNA